MNTFYKNLSMWLVIGLTMILLFQMFNKPQRPSDAISYSEFWSSVESGAINKVSIQGEEITGVGEDGRPFKTVAPSDTELLPMLRKSDVNISVNKPEATPWYLTLFVSWFPMLLLIGVWIFFMRQMQMGGKGGALSFGKTRAKLQGEGEVKVTFKDVAGIDEAKEELEEIIDFLRDPQKFTRLGGRIPKGVLLAGPPGTGKTLLARAIAGEAGVPFFSISGSQFVEMYVGIGASRVRDLFTEGKKKAPCIIFIDEIDAVGRHRSAGGGPGGNDEREQTLNQLLVEMDGFEVSDHVIVVAATNRQDILDPALLRPGRFDRQVMVPLPDVGGREKILRVHARRTRTAENVDWQTIARATPGFSGAQLASLVNEAALLMTRQNAPAITMDILEAAKDKVLMGAERRSLIITEREKRITACHEAGHALVAWMLPGADPVHKVTIIPRGRALGLTMQLPEEERSAHDRTWLTNTLCTLLGGRVAEEIVFQQMTTGAGNDIERVSDIARRMVCEWGMSEAIGPLTFRAPQPPGGQPGQILSEATATLIDAEVKKLVQSAADTARQLLTDNRPALEALTTALLERETLNRDDIRAIVDRARPQPTTA